MMAHPPTGPGNWCGWETRRRGCHHTMVNRTLLIFDVQVLNSWLNPQCSSQCTERKCDRHPPQCLHPQVVPSHLTAWTTKERAWHWVQKSPTGNAGSKLLACDVFVSHSCHCYYNDVKDAMLTLIRCWEWSWCWASAWRDETLGASAQCALLHL